MPKLNQIIAIANGTKGRSQRALTEAHHKVQKAELVSGISRTYRPKDEEGDRLPSESKKVHYTVQQALVDAEHALSTLFDVVATQDGANCVAKADVVVDNRALLVNVPVTTLLFLEKQMVDFHTFVEKLPALDTSEKWEYDPAADCFATPVSQTVRTKKVPRNHVKAEATKEHPAQVDVYMEDIVDGYWDTVKFSGAIQESLKNAILERTRKLLDAIKMAREEANCMVTDKVEIANSVFGYLLDGIGKKTSAS